MQPLSQKQKRKALKWRIINRLGKDSDGAYRVYNRFDRKDKDDPDARAVMKHEMEEEGEKAAKVVMRKQKRKSFVRG